MSGTAGASSPSPGGAPAGTGYLLGSVLLVVDGAVDPQAVDVTVDSLMLGQRQPAQAGSLDQWRSALTGTLAGIGWTLTRSSATQQGLRPASWFHRTAVPWTAIQPAVGTPALATTVTSLLGRVPALPAAQLSRWQHATTFGSSALAAVAVVGTSAGAVVLDLTVAVLSYPGGDAVTVGGFPTAPVPASGAQLDVYESGHQLGSAQLADLQQQLDPLVAPVRSTITTLAPGASA